MSNGRWPPGRSAWSDTFRRKAASAWRAARRLARDHPESAANRAYYAVFNAVQARLGPRPWPPSHQDLTSRPLLSAVGLDAAALPTIHFLRGLRVLADYKPVDVTPNRARRSVGSARRILRRLGVSV